MSAKEFVKDQTSQDLSAGTLTHTYTASRDFYLHQALMTFSGNVSETIAVAYLDSNDANYEHQLDASTLSAADDYVYNPGKPILIKSGDQVKVTCTNGGGVNTAYSTILGQER